MERNVATWYDESYIIHMIMIRFIFHDTSKRFNLQVLPFEGSVLHCREPIATFVSMQWVRSVLSRLVLDAFTHESSGSSKNLMFLVYTQVKRQIY